MAIKKRNTRKNKSMLGGTTEDGYYTFEDRRNLAPGTQFIREIKICPEGYTNCNDKCIVKNFGKNQETQRYYLTYAKASNPDDLRYAEITMSPEDQAHVLLGIPLAEQFGEPDINNYLTFSMKVPPREDPPREDPLESDGKFILFDLKGTMLTYSYLVYAEKEKFDAHIYSSNYFPPGIDKSNKVFEIIFRGFSLCNKITDYPPQPEYCNKMFQIKNKSLVEIENGYYDNLHLYYNKTSKSIIPGESFIEDENYTYHLTNIRILDKTDIKKEFFENRETEYNTFILKLANTQTRPRGGKRNTRRKISKKKRRKSRSKK